MFDAGAAVGFLGLDVNPFEKGVLRAESLMRLFPATVTNFMASPLLGVVGIAQQVGSALTGLFSTGFELAVNYEQAEVAFGVLLGGADKATAALKDLSDFAAATPFEFPELQQAARSLLAFGIEQERMIPTLRMVGDVASGIGAPLGQIAEIYGKARVQGRLFMEDINQLTGRGIPVIQQLAAQFGVAESEVRKLVETGQVNFGHLERSFESLTGAGGMFSGMMEKQSHTMAGQWSTLKDNWNLLLRELATPVMVAVKPELENLLKWMGENQDEAKIWARDFAASIAEIAGNIDELVVGMKVAIDTARTFLDLVGVTDPNRRFKQPYDPSSQKGLLFEGVNQDPSVLRTEAGRRAVQDAGAYYGGSAERLIGATDRIKPFFDESDKPYVAAKDATIGIRGQLEAYYDARDELTKMAAAAEAGGDVSTEKFREAMAVVESFASAVEKARAELTRLRDEQKNGVLWGNPSIIGELDSALRTVQQMMDAARIGRQGFNDTSADAALGEKAPGRPTVNIERIVIEAPDPAATGREIGDRIAPLLREAQRQQLNQLQTPLLNEYLRGRL